MKRMILAIAALALSLATMPAVAQEDELCTCTGPNGKPGETRVADDGSTQICFPVAMFMPVPAPSGESSVPSGGLGWYCGWFKAPSESGNGS